MLQHGVKTYPHNQKRIEAPRSKQRGTEPPLAVSLAEPMRSRGFNLLPFLNKDKILILEPIEYY
jgi:hypothetical protein